LCALGALVLSGALPRRGRAGEPGVRVLLAVSGRSSFEIVQKAATAGLPVVCSLSAASSLAADLADACGVTLVGFVRGVSLSVYTHPERIAQGTTSAVPRRRPRTRADHDRGIRLPGPGILVR
jgi:FdhD protein